MSYIRILFIGLCIFISSLARAQFPTDPRSDSIDITRQHIVLSITDFTNKTISGYTDIQCGTLVNNVHGISLDLFHFTIDSIFLNGSTVPFTYNDSLIHIKFPSVIAQNDSASIRVWYHGLAQQGSGGWGGFYWSQGIAFNMGVTLYDIPHNAGRFWFPCFDNFTEKAFYEVTITTQSTHAAVCGGTLISQSVNQDFTKNWSWKLHKPVPSYLVSVAVGPFAFVHKTFTGSQGQIPVTMAAVPSDTTAMKNSFANLEAAFHIYEQFYGPYLWERVGYVLVPFNGGAMEHATNIAYQKTLVDGNLTYETVMAHELSHHWWGDLVTCQTAEDMWINEGMAVFSEYLFTEQMYGRQAAINAIRASHTSVLKTAHTTDGGYQPLSGVPQAYTYGTHSYDKGGNVAWSMRGYLGDSLFFQGLQSVLTTYTFKNVNALQFRDQMTAATGYNMTPFFADWILQPGFAEFLLDSFTVAPSGGQYNVAVYTSQRLRAANHLYTEVPLEVTFIGANRQSTSRVLTHSSEYSNASFLVPFEPVAVFINRSQKLFYAVTADEKEMKSTGNSVQAYSNIRFTVASVTDSALVRSEYHWAKPDDRVTDYWKYELTPDRFWKIDGIFPAGFSATATFPYDGAATGPDYPIIYKEDSVVLFYRKNNGDYWKPAANYTLSIQNATDKKGNITAPLLKGEYCIGVKRETVSISEVKPSQQPFMIYPNPSDGSFRIRFDTGKTPGNYKIEIYDSQGKMVYIGTPKQDGEIDLRTQLRPGKYVVKAKQNGKEIGTVPMIINY